MQSFSRPTAGATTIRTTGGTIDRVRPERRRQWADPRLSLVVAAIVGAAAGCASLPDGCASPRVFELDRSRGTPTVSWGEVRGNDLRTRVPFEFVSPDGGRVPAMMWDPVRPGPRPTVILAHGMPGTRMSLSPLAEAYAAAGARVISISAPWSRPDSPIREPVLFTLPLFSESDRIELIQYVRDLRRTVDVALSLPDAEPSEIAFVGHSYGGSAGGILAGVEPRIAAFALASTPGGLHQRFPADWAAGDATGGVEKPLGSAEWKRTLQDIDARCFLALAAGDRVLLQYGRQDRLVPEEVAATVEAAAPPGTTVLEYDTDHALGPDAWVDQAHWLAERIEIDVSRFGAPTLRSRDD